MTNFHFVGNIAEDLPKHSHDIGIIQFGETIDGTFHGISYHRASIQASQALKQYFPAILLDMLEHTLMTINREVPPHVDNAISWVINVYLQTNNCITQFYASSDDAKGFQIRNQTNGRIFNAEDLTPADSFIANVGDIYILDVTKPHAVLPLEPGPVQRSALCYQARGLPYQQLMAMLAAWEQGNQRTMPYLTALLGNGGIML